MKKIKKMQDGGAPCGPDEVRTPGGRCIKKRFITSPEGVASVVGAATAVGAAIKNKIAKRKEDKAEVAKMMKDIKSASSKKKMQAGGASAGQVDRMNTNTTAGQMPKYPMKKGGTMKKYKTGGMVNSNAKVSALKTAGSKGTKSGVNSKVSASKVAKGRVGGTSAAPKKAKP